MVYIYVRTYLGANMYINNNIITVYIRVAPYIAGGNTRHGKNIIAVFLSYSIAYVEEEGKRQEEEEEKIFSIKISSLDCHPQKNIYNILQK